MLLVGVREYTCILFNFFILNGTTWGSGKKGGQGWGETLVITIVVQGAGYYPPSLHARSFCTGRRVSVSFYVSLRDLRSNPL